MNAADLSNIFLEPGRLEGTDVVLPAAALRPNKKGDAFEEVKPATLGARREVLISHVVLLRPDGWQAALKKAPIIRGWNDVQNVVQHLHMQDYESVVVLALDAKGRLMAIHEAATGGLHGAAVDVRHAFKVAALVGAYAAIIVHNHPSGDPTASADDVRLTEQIIAASRVAGIYIIDHVIVAYGGQAQSFVKTHGLERHQNAPPYTVGVEPVADVTIGLRESTEEGKVLRRLWGGNGKLVVRTGLVPPAVPEPVRLGSPQVFARMLATLNMRSGDLAIVGVDGKNNLRGLQLIEEVDHKSSEAALRDILGFALAVSSSTMIFGYQSGAPTKKSALDAAKWLRPLAAQAYALVPVNDVVAMDTFGDYASFHEYGVTLR